MTMHKTSELSSKALDYAVARCLKYNIMVDTPQHQMNRMILSGTWDKQALTDVELCLKVRLHIVDLHGEYIKHCPNFSSDIIQAYDIINSENIHVRRTYNNGIPNSGQDAYYAQIDFINGKLTLGTNTCYGSTLLIASMRCYVKSVCGDTIELPDHV